MAKSKSKDKGNVFKAKGDDTKKPDAVKKESKEKAKSTKSISSLKAKVSSRKSKSITGAIMLLLSLYLFLAFVSYLFSWKTDQNLILSNSFWEFVFGDTDIEVANWVGKFGAWISYVFLYKWFGIISFVFTLLLFITGIFLLFNVRLLPIKRTYTISFIAIIWTSIFLSLFSSSINHLGGTFGFVAKEWLTSIFGLFGAILLMLVTLFIIIVSLFNPDFKAIFDKYFPKKGDKEDVLVEKDTENTLTRTLAEDDSTDSLPVEDDDSTGSSPIEDDEDDLDFVVKTTDLDENEVDDTNDDNDIDTDEEDTISMDVDGNEEDNNDDDEFDLAVKPTTLPTSIDDDEFSVEVAQKEKELTSDEVNTVLEVSGPYDPRLDLSRYKFPELELLRDFGDIDGAVSKEELEKNKDNIVNTLANYKIEIAKIKATIGPTVTLYEIIPAPGVRISKIKNLEDDIALSLAALGIRIIAPIPGKGTIGIEVPNSSPQIVSMRSLIASEKFQKSNFQLPVVLGKTITNETFAFDLAKMPHLLVAGATGQGKSVGLNAILVSLLYKKHPAEIKFVLIDPKKVELTLYNKIERHFLAKLPGEEDAIITDTSKVVNTLNSLTIEMDARYDLLKDAQVRTIIEYNEKFIARKLNPELGHRYMPYIVVLIDEFADLIMTAGKDVEHPIARLAQLARAIGIHLIVATQRPSVNVITGMIKANFPARIAFRVLSKIDSRTILDTSGADQLIGKGDMLISTGSDLVRLQCGFVDTPEVEAICDFIGEQQGYNGAFELPEYVGEASEGNSLDVDDELDANFAEAARLIVLHQQGSTSLIQRKLKLGYNRAGRIIDQLEFHGVVGPFQGSKAREVNFKTSEELERYLAEKGLL